MTVANFKKYMETRSLEELKRTQDNLKRHPDAERSAIVDALIKDKEKLLNKGGKDGTR